MVASRGKFRSLRLFTLDEAPRSAWLQVSATEDAGLDSSDEEVGRSRGGPSQGASYDCRSPWTLEQVLIFVGCRGLLSVDQCRAYEKE